MHGVGRGGGTYRRCIAPLPLPLLVMLLLLLLLLMLLPMLLCIIICSWTIRALI